MDSTGASPARVRMTAKCPGQPPRRDRAAQRSMRPRLPRRQQKLAAFHEQAQSRLCPPSLPRATTSVVAPAANTAAKTMAKPGTRKRAAPADADVPSAIDGSSPIGRASFVRNEKKPKASPATVNQPRSAEFFACPAGCDERDR